MSKNSTNFSANNKNNPKLKQNAQSLRANMTPEEKHLWFDFLAKLPVTVNRQKVVGGHIVDFYCAKAKLVIELDGQYHSFEETSAKDAKRDAALNSLGITVVRFKNKQINEDFHSVCDKIYRLIFENEN